MEKVQVNYSNIYQEVYEVIKNMPKDLKEKVPMLFITFLNYRRNPNYKFQYDESKSLVEQNLMPETKQILVSLYLNNICTPKRRKEIMEQYKNRTQQVPFDYNTFFANKSQSKGHKIEGVDEIKNIANNRTEEDTNEANRKNGTNSVSVNKASTAYGAESEKGKELTKENIKLVVMKKNNIFSKIAEFFKSLFK